MNQFTNIYMDDIKTYPSKKKSKKKMKEDEGASMAGDMATFTPVLGTTQKRLKEQIEALEEELKELNENSYAMGFGMGLAAKAKKTKAQRVKSASRTPEDKENKKLQVTQNKIKKAEVRKNTIQKLITKLTKEFEALDVSIETLSTVNESTQPTKDNNMIEETVSYKYYNDGDKKIFEILDESDFHKFYQGLKRSNNRFWRNSPMMGGSATTEKMMEKMNENRGLWFEVRFQNRVYKPFDKGF